MDENWNLTGQEKAISRLRADISAEKISHAYLFSGPKNIGKTSAAKRMAQVLQCREGGCLSCRDCLQVEKNSHTDMTIIEDNGHVLGIDLVKEIVSKINMTPQSNYKIFILQNIERMTREAANSFLKALEEPPPRSLIILTTSDYSQILPTIVSRSRLVVFQAENKELESFLRKKFEGVSRERVKMALLFSSGRTGSAISLLSDEDLFAVYERIFDEARKTIEERTLAERFFYVEGLCSQKDEKNFEVNLFLTALALLLREKLFSEKDPANREKYIKSLSKIVEAGILFKRNVNQRLFLETLMFYL